MPFDEGHRSQPGSASTNSTRRLHVVPSPTPGGGAAGCAKAAVQLDSATPEWRQRRPERTVDAARPERDAPGIVTALVDHPAENGAAVAAIDQPTADGPASLPGRVSVGPAPVSSTSITSVLAAVGDGRLGRMRLLDVLVPRHARQRPLLVVVVDAGDHGPAAWMLDHLPDLLHDAAVTWLRFAPGTTKPHPEGAVPVVAPFDEPVVGPAPPPSSATVTRLHRVAPAAGRAPGGSSSRRVERPRFGWDSLTETELKVVRLVADGHSNRSAAAALVVSANTVSTHLRSAFTKLDVNSRVQLTRVALRHLSMGDHP